MTQKFATDYIDVAARIAEFRKKYPEGTLQPADLARPFVVLEVGGKQRIIVVAAAYRTPDDPRPGIGMAYEEVPGRTPYTKDSELQNAETSAWGRAIVAVGAADTKKGIASAEDVRNRQADQEAPTAEDFTRKHGGERKAERGVPADDPWQNVAQPPTATDTHWYTGWTTRVGACTSLGVLRGLHGEMVEQHRLRKLTDDDRREAEQLVTDISENLKTVNGGAA